MSTYVRPDATLPAIAEFGGRADMSPQEIGYGWSTTSQTRPPADRFNTRDFLNSAAVKYLCRLGIAEWSPDEQYQGRGLVIGSNGSVYWNLTPCTGVDPTTDGGGYWELTAVRAHDAMNLMGGALGGFLTMSQAQSLFVDWGTFNSTRDLHWSHITSAESNIDWINGRTTALEGWRNDLQNWANGADSNIGNLLWWRDNQVNPQLGDLYNRVNNADAVNNRQDGQINDLYGRVNNADNGIAAVNGRVDGLMPSMQGSAASGLLRFPNGVIQQWRSDFSQDVGAGELSRDCWFPQTFPNSCWHVQLSTGWGGMGQGNNMMMYQIRGWNSSYVSIYRARSGSNNTINTWPILFAIGN
jgi:hypothetical protein